MIENEGNQPVPETPKCPRCGTALPAGALGGLCPACLLKQGASGDTATQPETAPFVPPSVAELAKLFPQLEIVRLLGKGGMGAVYLARQPNLDRLVALKILPAQTDADSGFAERFTREARALARLSHPNIVMVHEFGVAGSLHYFLMEYVEGVNLRQLQLSSRLSPHEALNIVPQLCDALQYAHDQGVVHRDIKPENVLVDRRGRVKIADFGLAKMLGHDTASLRLTGEGHVMGTPHYMSPEQIERPLEVDHRADIYSLGVVFYEMLTGELPLGRFGPPSSKVQIDVRLDEVVMRTLEKEPNRRYQHAGQVKTAVDTITHSAPPPPPADAAQLAKDILARGYALNIGSCFSRGWALVKGDFFPLVGVTALVMVLLSIAGSFESTLFRVTGQGPWHFFPHRTQQANDLSFSLTGILELLVLGPLMGGLYLHFLKKIRGEVTGIETAFSGFKVRLLHLFLGLLVGTILTMLGFVFCIVPGIYLAVAWMFLLPLIIDKKIDFWPAMELSRKVVTRHWWKLFGLCLVCGLIFFAGALCCGIGVFLAAPVIVASLMYAYEDIFGAAPTPAAVSPTGTTIMPNAPVKPAPVGAGTLRPFFMALAGVVLIAFLFIAVIVMAIAIPHVISQRRAQAEYREQAAQAQRERDALLDDSWAPTLADGEKPDPVKISREANNLMEKGQYEDALRRDVWYWNHALEFNPSLNGVRLSFFLSDWVELGRRYPAAKQALIDLRNRDAAEFAAGRGYFKLFNETVALNEYLQEEDASEELFKNLPENDHALAEQCFPYVKELLVKKHEYALYMSHVPDPQSAFDEMRQEWEQRKKFAENSSQQGGYIQKLVVENNSKLSQDSPDMLPPQRPMRQPGFPTFTLPAQPKLADNNFISQTRLLIEALVGTDRKPEAQKIRDEAVALLPDDRLKSAVSDAEKRIAQNN